jgi:putative component of toxin-antitoxin plasmid stabilization module
MREAQTVSPDSMVREDPSSEAISPPNGWRCYWKKCTFLAMLLLCSLMLGYQVNTQKT